MTRREIRARESRRVGVLVTLFAMQFALGLVVFRFLGWGLIFRWFLVARILMAFGLGAIVVWWGLAILEICVRGQGGRKFGKQEVKVAKQEMEVVWEAAEEGKECEQASWF